MRIALVTPWDVEDPHSWSGVVRPMVRHLRQVADVVVVPCGQEAPSPVDRMMAGLLGRGAGMTYLTGHAMASARRRGHALGRRLEAVDCDVLGVTASAPLAYLPADRPVVQVTDATFGAITDYYPLYTGLPGLVRRQGEAIERRSASKTDGWVVASHWAADSLVDDYEVDVGRICVAPFGSAAASSRARRETDGALRVLVVSSDWERKGGPTALAVVDRVQAAGTPIRLTVAGNHPALPHHVVSLGRVSRERMAEVYTEHDVLLELAAANASGVTLTDAAHAGLPAIATRTGGVPDIVLDGASGFLVPVGPQGVAVAAQRLTELTEPETHQRLVRGAREHARDVLSWDRWADDVAAVCAQVVGQ